MATDPDIKLKGSFFRPEVMIIDNDDVEDTHLQDYILENDFRGIALRCSTEIMTMEAIYDPKQHALNMCALDVENAVAVMNVFNGAHAAQWLSISVFYESLSRHAHMVYPQYFDIIERLTERFYREIERLNSLYEPVDKLDLH